MLVEYMSSFHLRVCIIRGHVLQFVIYYWSICFTRVHILQDDLLNREGDLLDEDRFYWRVYVFESHVWHDGMSCRSTCSMNGHTLLRYMI